MFFFPFFCFCLFLSFYIDIYDIDYKADYDSFAEGFFGLPGLFLFFILSSAFPKSSSSDYKNISSLFFKAYSDISLMSIELLLSELLNLLVFKSDIKSEFSVKFREFALTEETPSDTYEI